MEGDYRKTIIFEGYKNVGTEVLDSEYLNSDSTFLPLHLLGLVLNFIETCFLRGRHEFLSCPASFGHPVSRIPPNSRSFLDSADPSLPPQSCCVLASELLGGLVPGQEGLLPTEAGQGHLQPGPPCEGRGSSQ